jgi:hypothetical protein
LRAFAALPPSLVNANLTNAHPAEQNSLRVRGQAESNAVSSGSNFVHYLVRDLGPLAL